jgi:hypothetical protein
LPSIERDSTISIHINQIAASNTSESAMLTPRHSGVWRKSDLASRWIAADQNCFDVVVEGLRATFKLAVHMSNYQWHLVFSLRGSGTGSRPA